MVNGTLVIKYQIHPAENPRPHAKQQLTNTRENRNEYDQSCENVCLFITMQFAVVSV